MSRKDSNPSRRGFTLLEVLVALGAAGILLTILVRFYRDSYRAYNLQDDIAERNQNAYYVIKRMTEILDQAGASLPDTGSAWTVIKTISSPNALVVGFNPDGGMTSISTSIASTKNIPVDNGSGFEDANYMLVDYTNPAKSTALFTISSVDTTHRPSSDTVRLGSNVTLSPGDEVYAYSEDTIWVSNDSLLINHIDMAEDIDSLGVTFYDVSQHATTVWKNMRSAQITVRARTNHQDPNLKTVSGYSINGYRIMTLTMNVRMRNKL